MLMKPGKLQCYMRRAAVIGVGVLCMGHAHAQSIDCYDRAVILPANATAAADNCHRKVVNENTTNDRHSIALYNAARAYIALADVEQDKALKAAAYDNAVADLIESRERAADGNIAFTAPWRKGDKRSQAAQMATNRFFVANRSFLLGRAYFELGKLNGAGACQSREACFEKAATELEHDTAARAAGKFRDEYVFLRASVYLAWDQSTLARRDLELLRESPEFGALARQKLGDMFLVDAKRHLGPPLTLPGVLAARVAYRSAISAPTAALAGQLGVAETFLLEAGLIHELADRRARYADAAREFGQVIGITGQQGALADRMRAHEGRGAALLRLALLGEKESIGPAIADLREAAALASGLDGAPAQLLLARALSEAGHGQEADAAYDEAVRRFGADSRAALARAEQAFARGGRLFAAADDAGAHEQFQRALTEAAWLEGRADAYYFLSAIAMRAGQNAVANADSAAAAGGGALPYREQACLARVAAGGQTVQKKLALPACAGSDVLLGLFYLRHAQLAQTAGIANESRRLAQEAFVRAQGSDAHLTTSPGSPPIRVSDVAKFGGAVALGCSSSAGLNVSVDLDAARLEATKAFFVLHRVHNCRATN